ncbi:hypothetical protein CF328_g9623 [Tilletia controversa]|nr:hypothetical protein CF328_g9623 [Tilletia controversa]
MLTPPPSPPATPPHGGLAIHPAFDTPHAYQDHDGHSEAYEIATVLDYDQESDSFKTQFVPTIVCAQDFTDQDYIGAQKLRFEAEPGSADRHRSLPGLLKKYKRG